MVQSRILFVCLMALIFSLMILQSFGDYILIYGLEYMSRTYHKVKKIKRGVDKEYWKSRLHRYGEILGKFTKKLTHKKERKECKIILDLEE